MTIEEKIQKMAEEYVCSLEEDTCWSGADFYINADPLIIKAYITAAREFYKQGWDDRGKKDKSLCMRRLNSSVGPVMSEFIEALKCPLEDK